ncbi:MAG TPA: ABC transporter permease [Acidimicrobiales bacterium]|nr:ABC transporter permease [Acidimicrobiales bacterium]
MPGPKWKKAVGPGTWLPPLAAGACLVGLWQLLAVEYPFNVPTVAEVWRALSSNFSSLVASGGYTLSEALPGVALSFTVALVLAVAMNQSRLLTRALLPIAVTLNSTPLIAFAPGLVAVFGFNPFPRVLLAAVITFFPALINAMTGLSSADPRAEEVFQTLSASRWEVLWRLRLPASLPYLFAGARIVVPLSIVSAAVAEMLAIGSNNGLGHVISNSYDYSQFDLAWAAIVVLGAIGVALMGLVVLAEDRVLRWRGFR